MDVLKIVGITAINLALPLFLVIRARRYTPLAALAPWDLLHVAVPGALWSLSGWAIHGPPPQLLLNLTLLNCSITAVWGYYLLGLTWWLTATARRLAKLQSRQP